MTLFTIRITIRIRHNVIICHSYPSFLFLLVITIRRQVAELHEAQELAQTRKSREGLCYCIYYVYYCYYDYYHYYYY